MLGMTQVIVNAPAIGLGSKPGWVSHQIADSLTDQRLIPFAGSQSEPGFTISENATKVPACGTDDIKAG
jgi:hypothetical protein